MLSIIISYLFYWSLGLYMNWHRFHGHSIVTIIIDLWYIRLHTFYSFWTFIAQPLYALQIELFAWATIERHIQWVSTSKKRFFVHYLPVGIISTYYLVYYGLVFFGAICFDSFDTFFAIGFHIPCAFDHTILGVWDLLFHQVFPLLIIVLFSIALIVRTVLQKRRLHQGVNWRKHRKMITQLLSISTIYIMFNSPWVFSALAFQYGLPLNITLNVFSYTSFVAPMLYLYFHWLVAYRNLNFEKNWRPIFDVGDGQDELPKQNWQQRAYQLIEQIYNRVGIFEVCTVMYC